MITMVIMKVVTKIIVVMGIVIASMVTVLMLMIITMIGVIIMKRITMVVLVILKTKMELITKFSGSNTHSYNNVNSKRTVIITVGVKIIVI